MTLEELIYQRLVKAEPISELLAKYNGIPAVFYQTAPMDKDPGWKGKAQYPRIDYIVDMQADPERNSSGVLTINLFCSEHGIPPEEIEPHIRDILQDIFILPDNSCPFSLAWARTDAFEQRGGEKPETLVVGVTILFDVFAFPSQETIDPDPVLAFNEFVKTWAKEVLVIGKDEMNCITHTTEERPIFYCRLVTLQTQRETNTVVWMDGVLAVHIFAPEEVRIKWLRAITDALALAGEVTMLDTSPMFIKNIRADSSAAPLTTGQLRLQVHFGILRRPAFAHQLKNIHTAIGG